MIEWRWDQGRVLYFQFDVIKEIAKVLVKYENKNINDDAVNDEFRSSLMEGVGLPFLPLNYKVNRNYSRVFQCAMLGRNEGGTLIVSDICKQLSKDDSLISNCDDYLYEIVKRFRYPFPAFQFYDTESPRVYPFCAVLNIPTPSVVDATYYGVPQHRKRWIAMGTRGHKKIEIPAPRLAETSCGHVFMRSLNGVPNHVTRKHNAESVLRYSKLKLGERDHLGRVDRLDPYKPSKTVIAGGVKGGGRSHLHPFTPRTISVRECARLQTFPDNYEFVGTPARQYTQVGNAVPPMLAYHFALAIKEAIIADYSELNNQEL